MGFFKILFFIILFSYAYKAIRKLLFPAAVSQAKANRAEQTRRFAEQFFQNANANETEYTTEDKSGEVEDIDYEEVD